MRAILDLLWPRLCLACGALMPTAAGSGLAGPPLGLCPDCARRLVAIDPAASCATCARPLARAPPSPDIPGRAVPSAPSRRCGRCLLDPPAFERLTALWRYETPLREVVHAFKFGRLDFLGAHFARALAGALSDLPDGIPDWIVPLPLPWPRRLLRGFNQTELVAAPLASACGRPCRRALRRRLFARRQTGQGRAGRGRAAHFFVPAPRALAGRTVLLVDDVVTTGATLRAASAALRHAGAIRVEAVVVGWTPLDGPRELAGPSGTASAGGVGGRLTAS